MPKIIPRLKHHKLPRIQTRGKTVPQLVKEIEKLTPQVAWQVIPLAPRTAVLYDTKTNDRIVVRGVEGFATQRANTRE